jgi:hypothetical protein
MWGLGVSEQRSAWPRRGRGKHRRRLGVRRMQKTTKASTSPARPYLPGNPPTSAICPPAVGMIAPARPPSGGGGYGAPVPAGTATGAAGTGEAFCVDRGMKMPAPTPRVRPAAKSSEGPMVGILLLFVVLGWTGRWRRWRRRGDFQGRLAGPRQPGSGRIFGQAKNEWRSAAHGS